jgi:hypothetical protein
MSAFRLSILIIALSSSFELGEAQWRLEPGTVNYGMSNFASFDTVLIAGSTSGIIWTSLHDSSWHYAVVPRENFWWLARFDSIVIASGLIDLYYSTDQGREWNLGSTFPNTWVNSIVRLGDTVYLGTGRRGILRSLDKGKTWNVCNLADTAINCLANDGSILYAGTNSESIFRSTNGGTRWDLVYQTNGVSSLTVYSLFVHRHTLLAGVLGLGVCRSTDSAATWGLANNGLSHLVIMGFASSSDMLFVGTQVGGVGVSKDEGQTWLYIGLKEQSIRSIYVWQGFLYVGTWEGVWRRSLADIVLTNVPLTSSNSTKFSLNQNYPNPFNPSTTIKFELPRSSDVKLSVFDMLGREISVLVNERREAGVHEVKFDASGLSSGVYFYRLTAGTFVQARKLLLLR